MLKSCIPIDSLYISSKVYWFWMMDKVLILTDEPLTTDNGPILSRFSKHRHTRSHPGLFCRKNADLPHSCLKLKSLQPVWHYSFQEKLSAKHTHAHSFTQTQLSHVEWHSRVLRHSWSRCCTWGCANNCLASRSYFAIKAVFVGCVTLYLVFRDGFCVYAPDH